ncbi:MAG: methylated-DNA--[protein]-cysteine S-methyltransferase [Patescibacteria group bacterium]|nr:methylated-DNA--[protein]-cysteine S-methyltransferase [Patescibacteria group bacterium]
MIYTCAYISPLGTIILQSNESFLIRLSFVDKPTHDERICDILQLAMQELDEYFSGVRQQFSVPISQTGTPFQLQTWNHVCSIPYGKTSRYSDIAKQIGNHRACRAVGNALNINTILIIVPCHRVIGNHGKICGYAGGAWRKTWLLAHEQKFSS